MEADGFFSKLHASILFGEFDSDGLLEQKEFDSIEENMKYLLRASDLGRILTDIFGEKLQDNELLTTYLNNLSTTDIEEYEDCGNGEREKDSYYKEEDQTIQLNVKEDVDKNCLKRSGTESEDAVPPKKLKLVAKDEE